MGKLLVRGSGEGYLAYPSQVVKKEMPSQGEERRNEGRGGGRGGARAEARGQRPEAREVRLGWLAG
jgi:hypothetical protein